jgi:hypothetical protein
MTEKAVQEALQGLALRAPQHAQPVTQPANSELAVIYQQLLNQPSPALCFLHSPAYWICRKCICGACIGSQGSSTHAHALLLVLLLMVVFHAHQCASNVGCLTPLLLACAGNEG